MALNVPTIVVLGDTAGTRHGRGHPARRLHHPHNALRRIDALLQPARSIALRVGARPPRARLSGRGAADPGADRADRHLRQRTARPPHHDAGRERARRLDPRAGDPADSRQFLPDTDRLGQRARDRQLRRHRAAGGADYPPRGAARRAVHRRWIAGRDGRGVVGAVHPLRPAARRELSARGDVRALFGDGVLPLRHHRCRPPANSAAPLVTTWSRRCWPRSSASGENLRLGGEVARPRW